MSEYIRKLRKFIGHDPIIMCAAGILLINEKNHLLLQLRTDNHCWGIPGGAMDPGETLEETAKREVLEETGLLIKNPEFFGIYSGETQHFIYPNKDEVYYVNVIYKVTDFEGSIDPDPVESEDVRFFDKDSIPLNINRTDRPVIKDFLGKLG